MTQTKLLSPARVVVPKAEDGSDIGFATGEQIGALGAQIEALQADIALVTGLVQDGKLPVLAHPPLVIESPEILVPESVKVNNTEEEKVPVADAAVQAKLTELETKLEAVQTAMTDGSQKVQVSGTKFIISQEFDIAANSNLSITTLDLTQEENNYHMLEVGIAAIPQEPFKCRVVVEQYGNAAQAGVSNFLGLVDIMPAETRSNGYAITRIMGQKITVRARNLEDSDKRVFVYVALTNIGNTDKLLSSILEKLNPIIDNQDSPTIYGDDFAEIPSASSVKVGTKFVLVNENLDT